MSDRLLLQPTAPPPGVSAARSTLPRSVLLPFLLACGAFLLLHARSIVGPVVFYDDFQILVPAQTWQRTWDNLWVPQNEHAMPLGRLFCFALNRLAGRLSVLPFVTCWVGPLALLASLPLIYLFVRREMGHPFYALLAVIVFAVTSVYHQAVWWFAASFALFSLDTLLLGLLAAQRWRQTGRRFYLLLTMLACLLAPAWFAVGILAGPICSLYLLPTLFSRDPKGSALAYSGRLRNPARLWLAAQRVGLALLPLAGTALFLAISLPRTADTIMHLTHYGDRTAIEAFGPGVGLVNTGRSLVDNLLLGLLGISGIAIPWWLLVPILLGVLAAAIKWWRQASEHRLMLLGLGLIVSSYELVYSARSAWDYEEYMIGTCFARYHLLPQLGLALFICGGLSGYAGRWFTLDPTGTLTAGQRRFVYWLIAGLFVINLPRGLLCSSPTGWDQFDKVRDQITVLHRVEEVDARCRRYHISAEAARQALGMLNIPCSEEVIDGWELLRGSDDPHTLPMEEVKRLLEAP